ncbi:MAG: glycosyltransferase family 4 protein [Chloroflexi bacterium]|nr:glycosyltransferase family 4 protein [Chloroflexota bacterium]
MSTPLRIALLSTPHTATPPDGYGASELIAGLLAEALVAAGHAVTVFGRSGSPTPARLASFPEADGHPTFDGRELIHAARAMARSGEFDVVHNHCLAAGPALAGLARAPVVSTLHYLSPILRAFPEHDVVAVSEHQRARAAELGLNVVATIHNGVDLTRFTFERQKDDYLLFLGRFHPNKGAHLAIAAARRLDRRLVIAAPGPPPDQVGYFEEAIRPHLDSRIEWIGEVRGRQKDELLGRAHCLLMPACWDEPFGLVLVEAMACGTPVVALGRGAIPEIVDHGRTGFVVHDADELPAAADRAGSIDPAACRRHVEAHFTAERMAREYAALYHRLAR